MVEITMPATLRLLLKDQWDIRSTQRGVLTMEGGNTITADIPAIKGDQGDRGQDGAPPRFHEPVREEDLPNPLSLTRDDIGWMWPIKGSATVWTWNGFSLLPIPNYLGQLGPIGPAPDIVVGEVRHAEAARVTARQDAEGIVTLDFDIPQGKKGAPGDKGAPGSSGSISQAKDFDDGGEPARPGDVLTLHPDGTWRPMPAQIGAGSIKKSGADSDWQAVNTGAGWRGDYSALTTLTVPPQPWPWEPEVYGLVDLRVDGIMIRVDVEARLGAVSGPLLALGAGTATTNLLGEWTPRQIFPAADETASFNDSSTVVPAGQSAEIYLIARRVESLSSIWLRSRKERAYLRVNVNPVRVE